MNNRFLKKLTLVLASVLMLSGCNNQGGDNGGGSNTSNYSGTYYNFITATSGKDLRDQLHSLITMPQGKLSYADLWNVYKSADLRDDGTIYDYYGDIHFTLDKQGKSYNKEGDSYNREHTIPQSWFGENSPMVSDAFQVIPTDGWINNKRGNYIFGEVTGSPTYSYTFTSDSTQKVKLGSGTVGTKTVTVFEPADCYKGDIARIYLYFVTCYYNKNLNQDSEHYSNYVFDSSLNNTSGFFGLTEYAKNLFLKWNEQDPVSQREIDRCNKVYAVQNNRNPYIDHPEYVDAIWGGSVVDPVGPTSQEPEMVLYTTKTDLNGKQILSSNSYTINVNQSVAFFFSIDGEFSTQTTDSSISYTFTGGASSFQVSKFFYNFPRLKGISAGSGVLTFKKEYAPNKFVSSTITISVV